MTGTNLKEERTLVIIKPDGIQRSLVGEIIKRIERTGLKFVAFKFFVPTKEQCISHYNKDDEWFKEKGGGVLKDIEKAGMKIEKKCY